MEPNRTSIVGRTKLGLVLLVGALGAWGCSPSSSTGSTGSGGSPGRGGTGGSSATGSGGSGTTGSGGGPGSGGSTTGSGGSGMGSGGTGGNSTTGSGGSGTTGSGGGPGSGGTGGGNGGSSGAGGAAGGGGHSGTGGAGGSAAGGSGGGGGAPVVHLDQPDQTIEGFGINDMYQGSALPTSLFDPSKDIGLSILRVGMDTNGLGNLQSPTSMSADMATVIAAGGKVIGSVWTPPANCKTNQSGNNGGQLCSADNIVISGGSASQCTSSENSTCYTSWATMITNFASANNLYAMSLQNEPEFASCGNNEPCNGTYSTALYTAKEMVAFANVAGPMLKAKGIKVISPETSEWNHLWGNTSACGSMPSGLKSSDPLKCGCFISNSSTPSATCAAAATVQCASTCTSGNGYDYGHALHADSTLWSKYIDIIGTHEYDSQTAFPWPTSDFPKDKEVWMTEMAGVKWWAEQGPSNDINDGVVVATWIHSALVTGEASAWLWWWYPGQGDNEGLLAQNGDTKRHYTLGNFSKFVRPGYVRVNVSGSAPANVLLSAYSGSSTVVVVAINSGASTVSVPISIAGGTSPASCTPSLTSANANLTSQPVVAVSGGSFTASLAGPSVTTFVCK